MLSRKLTSLIRASGCFARGMVTSRTPLAYSVPPPSILTSVCSTPVFTDPSLIKPYPKINILDLPYPLSKIISEKPTNIIPLEDQISGNVIEDPTKVIEQRAARLVVIRRKKMKKHKRKKLKKKMKFVWLKVRQRREMRKEKAFQAELMSKISEAENFNAMVYAKEKIDKANTVLLPRYWKGKRLPEFVIREELEKKQLKQKLRNEKIERRKSISTKVSDYIV